MTALALDRPANELGVDREYQPWLMQRQFHRSSAPIRCVVAGRQSGKTHAAAEEVVAIALSRPHTESCLLMPTYKSTKAALRHLKRAVALNGRNGQALLFLGNVYQAEGDNAKAKTAYERYLKTNPNGKFADDVKLILQAM